MNQKEKAREALEKVLPYLKVSDLTCIFGSAFSDRRHRNVEYICVKGRNVEYSCPQHRHPGNCCLNIAEEILMRKKGKDTTQPKCKKSRKNEPCSPAFYYCKKERAYYCFNHTHPYDMSCCAYSSEAWQSHATGSTFQQPDLVTPDKAAKECQKKGCTRRDPGDYYCSKRHEYRCLLHFHMSGSCCENIYQANQGRWHEDGGWTDDYSLEEEKPRKPLIAVKFANS